MKKFIPLLVFTTMAVSAVAQSQFGIFAGPQITSSRYSIYSKEQSNTPKYGFHLGGMMKIPFENKLSFSPAVFYSMKGYKVELKDRSFPPDTNAVDNNTTFHTLELAFLFQVDLGKNPDHFFVKFGPSLDFQLFGKEKFKLEDNTTVNQDIVFDFGGYGHFAANMILQLGYETQNGLMLSAQYSHGVGSINNADGGPRILHRVYGISIGKFLSRKKK